MSKGAEYAGLAADKAAEMLLAKMADHLGMDEAMTRREIVAAVEAMPPFPNTMAALEAAFDRAYRAVMWNQAVRFTLMEEQIEAIGPDDFVNRCTEALR